MYGDVLIPGQQMDSQAGMPSSRTDYTAIFPQRQPLVTDVLYQAAWLSHVINRAPGATAGILDSQFPGGETCHDRLVIGGVYVEEIAHNDIVGRASHEPLSLSVPFTGLPLRQKKAVGPLPWRKVGRLF